jgi:C-terminal processing protease CtpA/Prc
MSLFLFQNFATSRKTKTLSHLNAGGITRKLIMQYPCIPRVLGSFVPEVNKSGPAYECGIMPGDMIVQIGEERATSDMHA